MLTVDETERLAQNIADLGLDPIVYFGVVAAIARALDGQAQATAPRDEVRHANGTAVAPALPKRAQPPPRDDTWPPLRHAVAAAMKARGVSHADLAALIGAQPSSIHSWLSRSSRAPGAAIIEKLTAWLEQPAPAAEVPAVATFPHSGNGHAAAA